MAKNALENFKELQRAHEKFMKLSADDIVDHLEKSGFRLFQTLQVLTPKDTGYAVNGWIAVLSKAPSEWKPVEGKSSYSPKKFTIKGRIRFDSTIWISNNVPYIIDLDEGPRYSSQAPSGFTNDAYRLTVQYTERNVSRFNRKKYNV